jgi:hypothetical protein
MRGIGEDRSHRRIRNYWCEAIDDRGSGQMRYLKLLMLSRPPLVGIPDQSVIAVENGVRHDYVVATLHSPPWRSRPRQ